jgi:alanine racemase
MRNHAWVEIDVGTLADNVRRLRTLVSPGISFMAVVKGNAYGHGALLAAQAALSAGADRVGVTFATEGLELREGGITAPVHVLGAVAPEQVAELVAQDLTPCVSDVQTARALEAEAARRGRRLPVHLKVDTGLHRLGFSPRDAVEFALLSGTMAHLSLEGLATHMACADEGDVGETERQFHLFRETVEAVETRGIRLRFQHVAATSLLIDRPDMHLSLVRAGISLFGYAPLPGQAVRAGIRPVMSFKSRLAQIRTVSEGEGIGYEHRFRASRVSRIGTIPTGYIDGVLYGLDHGGHVLVRGKRAPVAGKGGMDYTLVDLTDVPEAQVWDEVVFIGRQGHQEIWADEWAALGGRSVEDILGGLVRKRVDRVVLGDG